MAKIAYYLLILLVHLSFVQLATAAQDFTALRNRLVAEIEEDVRATRHYIDKASLDTRVIETIRRVPRHQFVPADQIQYSYKNRPLPIGYGQTISQPFIVALMTDLLQVKSNDLVLEIGTGSGYQAAVLAELVRQVYSIEIIEPLAKRTHQLLKHLNYTNITTKVGDGYFGWTEKGPFDAIIVTAAADHVPPPLIQQLKVGGRMVIPVGSRFQTQQLLLIVKENEKTLTTKQILPVIFVPLTGKH